MSYATEFAFLTLRSKKKVVSDQSSHIQKIETIPYDFPSRRVVNNAKGYATKDDVPPEAVRPFSTNKQNITKGIATIGDAMITLNPATGEVKSEIKRGETV